MDDSEKCDASPNKGHEWYQISQLPDNHIQNRWDEIYKNREDEGFLKDRDRVTRFFGRHE